MAVTIKYKLLKQVKAWCHQHILTKTPRSDRKANNGKYPVSGEVTEGTTHIFGGPLIT